MPDDRQQLLAQADKALQRGDTAGAVAHYRRALALAPGDATVTQRLADTLARAGQENEARDLFVRLAEEQWKGGLRPRALALLRRAVKLGVPDRQLLTLLGQRLLELGHTADAREPLLDAAQIAEGQGDRENARLLYTRIADALPRDLSSREGLVRLTDETGDAAARAVARARLAVAALRAGDAARAFRQFAEAIETDVSSLPALERLGDLLNALASTTGAAPVVPDLPMSQGAAAAWTIVREAVAARVGHAGNSAVLQDLASAATGAPRVRLWAARLLIEHGWPEAAVSGLCGLADALETHPELAPELVEALSALIARSPGQQEAMDLLLRLTASAQVSPTDAPTMIIDGDRDLPLSAPPAPPAPSASSTSAPQHLSLDGRVRVLEARAFQRQGLEDRARQALAGVPAADREHPEVVDLERSLTPPAPIVVPPPKPAPPRPVPPPPAPKAPRAAVPDDDDAMFVLLDDDDVSAAAPAAPPAAPRAGAPAAAEQPPEPREDAKTGQIGTVNTSPRTTGAVAAQGGAHGVDLAQLEHSIASTIDGDDAETSYQMAVGLLEMGLAEQAVPLLSRVLADPARRIDAMVLLARARVDLGQAEQAWHEAVAVAHVTANVPPELRGELLVTLAELGFSLGHAREGAEAVAEIERIVPDHPMLPRLRELAGSRA